MKKLKISGPRILCRMKWWDKRDGNGIATSLDGTEYYVDISVVKNRTPLKDGEYVTLRLAEVIGCRAGADVRRAKVSERVRSFFQIAATLRFRQAQVDSALKQLKRLGKLCTRMEYSL